MSNVKAPSNIVICSQVYPPDPTAVGQYMKDLSEALAEHNHVSVYTARRGYANPDEFYERSERHGNLIVKRLSMASLGKGSMLKRIMGGLLFCLQCMARLTFTKDLNTVLVSTSPPMAGMIGVFIKMVRPKVRMVYWVMDLNPDQWVRVGGVSPTHPLVKMQNKLNRAIFNRADAVVVLDEFMYSLCAEKTTADNLKKFVTSPPWPQESALEAVPRNENPFIEEHDLTDSRILMFSGNLSPSSSIKVVLDALLAKPRDGVKLVVIGGGDGRRDVEKALEDGLTNVLLLPYVAFDKIKYSLSAGDIHIVSIGDRVVGINHPCKIYGAMAVARPILAISPEESHLASITQNSGCGWVIPREDVAYANEVLDRILELNEDELDKIGAKGKAYLETNLSQVELTQSVVDVVENNETGESASVDD